LELRFCALAASSSNSWRIWSSSGSGIYSTSLYTPTFLLCFLLVGSFLFKGTAVTGLEEFLLPVFVASWKRVQEYRPQLIFF
jgi:hypothetical protein